LALKRELFGVNVSAADYDRALVAIMQAASLRTGGAVTHMAVHALVTAARDPAYRDKVNEFELVAADGQPVRWALNFFEQTFLPDRVYGPELMSRLCRSAAESGVGVYLYGSTAEVIGALKANLLRRLPDLKVVGCEPSVFRPLTSEEDAALVERSELKRRRLNVSRSRVPAAGAIRARAPARDQGGAALRRRCVRFSCREQSDGAGLDAARRVGVALPAAARAGAALETLPVHQHHVLPAVRAPTHCWPLGRTSVPKLLVTGSSGLIGSEVVDYFCREGWQVHGADNNQRADLFGPAATRGGTSTGCRQSTSISSTTSWTSAIATGVAACVGALRPDLIVHTAAQPSHDLAAQRPFDDFDINAGGTLAMLEATRRHVPEAVFVFMSTNKVYGDRPNTIPLTELSTRWDYSDSTFRDGIPETFSIDQSKHSLFGVSKAAADVMVQEYGRYFGIRTCCLRGGCLTGPNHSGVELHGFLSYLVKCNLQGTLYRMYGYKGKQVRDNLHAFDVARFIHEFYKKPRCQEVYNIGGGRGNSCSILEAFARIESLSGKKMQYEYVEKNREGDHICYISDLAKARSHYRSGT
jgi:CDP-paratose 2-epimerase